MNEFNPVIHQPVRLRLMAALSSLQEGEKVDFPFLKKSLELTDGNLGAHLVTLEQAGFVDVEKIFRKKKPVTLISCTIAGKRAFAAHVRALREILNE